MVCFCSCSFWPVCDFSIFCAFWYFFLVLLPLLFCVILFPSRMFHVSCCVLWLVTRYKTMQFLFLRILRWANNVDNNSNNNNNQQPCAKSRTTAHHHTVRTRNKIVQQVTIINMYRWYLQLYKYIHIRVPGIYKYMYEEERCLAFSGEGGDLNVLVVPVVCISTTAFCTCCIYPVLPVTTRPLSTPVRRRSTNNTVFYTRCQVYNYQCRLSCQVPVMNGTRQVK